jgi:hypothetical protein
MPRGLLMIRHVPVNDAHAHPLGFDRVTAPLFIVFGVPPSGGSAPQPRITRNFEPKLLPLVRNFAFRLAAAALYSLRD